MCCDISIPIGTIKRYPDFKGGDIVYLFQFLLVQLKERIAPQQTAVSLFQFLLVQLKDI